MRKSQRCAPPASPSDGFRPVFPPSCQRAISLCSVFKKDKQIITTRPVAAGRLCNMSKDQSIGLSQKFQKALIQFPPPPALVSQYPPLRLVLGKH